MDEYLRKTLEKALYFDRVFIIRYDEGDFGLLFRKGEEEHREVLQHSKNPAARFLIVGSYSMKALLESKHADLRDALDRANRGEKVDFEHLLN